MLRGPSRQILQTLQRKCVLLSQQHQNATNQHFFGSSKSAKQYSTSAKYWCEQIKANYSSRNTVYNNTVKTRLAYDLVDWPSIEKNDFYENDAHNNATNNALPDDHVAFRTFNIQGIDLNSFVLPLQALGYQQREFYWFDDMNVRACWFQPPVKSLPRVFLSELLLELCTEQLQQIVHAHVDKKPFLGRPAHAMWQAERLAMWMDKPIGTKLLSQRDYDAVANESQYAAWTLLNGHRANHFTIPVTILVPQINTLEKFLAFYKHQGNPAMNQNGKIHCSEDKQLLQASTQAVLVPHMFRKSSVLSRVPGSFVEFIERYKEGFEVANANQVFESTANTGKIAAK